MNFEAVADVMLKPGIADPQGQTIERALVALGYSGVGEVRVGKHIELSVDAPSRADAHATVTRMCEQLLANTVIESYEVGVLEPSGDGDHGHDSPRRERVLEA